MYLLLVIGGAIVFLPQLIGHELATRGVIPSMLGGLWVLACFGLRYPLQMLPIGYWVLPLLFARLGNLASQLSQPMRRRAHDESEYSNHTH